MLEKGGEKGLFGERHREEHRDLLRNERDESRDVRQEPRGDRQGERRHENPDDRSMMSYSSRMDRMFDDFRRRFMAMNAGKAEEMEDLYLPVDIYDDGESVVVKAEIPGIKREDINVQLTPDSITISGQKSAEQRVDQKDYYRIERSFGSFTRSCRLPVQTVVESARATFRDGVLEVRILKSEAANQNIKRLNIE
jgi:HSP20 family protein